MTSHKLHSKVKFLKYIWTGNVTIPAGKVFAGNLKIIH